MVCYRSPLKYRHLEEIEWIQPIQMDGAQVRGGYSVARLRFWRFFLASDSKPALSVDVHIAYMARGRSPLKNQHIARTKWINLMIYTITIAQAFNTEGICQRICIQLTPSCYISLFSLKAIVIMTNCVWRTWKVNI